ncbi:HPP family protein [Rhizobium sp. B230/85]|uniref:HPP family protein n=1 Tax=unclassified Rhizobium TaxID=2613769 RepID=UPI001ADAF011|nr:MULTISPECIES: HPP family protein [unclassified Rhizobium]MBO9134229.1 HPP family protein [Rhizobium sp. B209b/85]QXZ97737.1 HPP family protein [Rhizobium sp. B230/85]
MHRHLRHFIHRHEPTGHWHGQLKAGIGACVGMLAVGALAIMTGIPLLIAPFGATAVLIFGQPKSPLAQPANVFGGYLIAAAIGSLAMAVAPGLWWTAAIAVGVAIGAMQLLRVTHPPAGAVPLVTFASHLSAGLLFTVVVVGALALIAIAVLHHAIPPKHQYPLRVD